MNRSGVEGPGMRLRIRPPGDDRSVAPGRPRQLGQRNSVARGDHLGDGAPEAVRPRAGGDEPGPVGGVLHVVGERDDLVVVVVPGPEHLPERHAQQAGSPCSEDDERLLRPAEGAVAAEAEGRLAAPGREGPRGLGKKDLRELLRNAATGTVFDVVSRHETPAGRAQRRRLAPGPDGRFVREEIDDVHVPGEEAVVEDPQIGVQLPVGRALDRPPTGPVALAALDEGQMQTFIPGCEVVGVAQPVAGAVGRFDGTDACDHPPELPHPEVEPHPQERLQVRRASPAAGRRDQRAQPIHDQQGLGIGRDRQTGPKFGRNGAERLRLSFQHPQQVHERTVPREPVRQGDAPRRRVAVLRRRCPEEDLVHRPQVVLAALEPVRVSRGRQVRMRREHVRDQAPAEELVNPLARLPDDRLRIEARAEDAGHVVEEPVLLPLLAEGGGGSRADQIVLCAEPRPQPPDEAGEVRPLGAVEGVQLVHHQVAERARLVPPPEPLVRGPDQQVVQHLVVREQDVGRVSQHRPPVRDHVLRPHCGRPRRSLPVLADEEPGRDPSPERRAPMDRRGDPPRLVGGQRVHRVDHDGFDPRFAGLPPAVVKDRVEEALRLPGTRAGRDDGRKPVLAPEPLHRCPLMPEGREPQRKFGERLAPIRRQLEGQGDREVRPLQQIFWLRQEVVQQPDQRLVRRREPRAQKVRERRRDFPRDRGRDQLGSLPPGGLFSQIGGMEPLLIPGLFLVKIENDVGVVRVVLSGSCHNRSPLGSRAFNREHGPAPEAPNWHARTSPLPTNLRHRGNRRVVQPVHRHRWSVSTFEEHPGVYRAASLGAPGVLAGHDAPSQHLLGVQVREVQRQPLIGADASDFSRVRRKSIGSSAGSLCLP